jgi:IS5 family transposase
VTGEGLEVILVDVTESWVQRPKRNRQRNKKTIKNRKNGQKRWYSGKKKYHTIKSQIVICAKTKIILAVFVDCGRTHDFEMWKKSIGVKVVKHIKIKADKGYQGIAELHPNSETPKKKPKGGKLTKEEKADNRRINSERIPVEHSNCRLKRFHILADRYRNRRRRFGLRLSLFCGLHNFELAVI